MASTYVNDLRIEEQATGENSGTWGTKVNSAFSQIAEAFSYGTKQLAADSDETFTMPDGTSDGTRSLYLKITSAGSLTATRTVTLGPNTVSKLWIIENATTGSQSITIAQGSGGTVTIPTGAVKMVYSDGAGAGAAVVDALTDVYLASVDHAAFGDNKKAVFGAGSDLQIYHDGSHSRIDDAGTGKLILRGNDAVEIHKYTGEYMITAVADGAVSLYHDDSAKLATTSTGIDVTGTVTADGLTVDGDVSISDSVPILRLDSPAVTWSGGEDLGGIDWYTEDTSGNGPAVMARIYSESSGTNTLPIPNMIFQTSVADVALKDRMRIDGTGDISFYEDTGTTAKLVWKASDERLGIGTTSPAELVNLDKSSGDTFVRFDKSGTFKGLVGISDSAGSGSGSAVAGDIILRSQTRVLLDTGGTTRAVVDASGNVGIGVTPSSWNSIFRAVQIGSADPSFIAARTDGPSQIHIGVNGYYDAGGSWRYINTDFATRAYQSSGAHYWEVAPSGTAGNAITFTQAMMLDSSGNLLVGETTNDTPGLGDTDVGASFRADGASFVSRTLSDTSGSTLYVNRNTYDGNLVQFQKDGTTVGSIVTSGGDLAIGTGNTKLRFNDASDAIYSGGGDGSGTNAGTDLGTSDYKFGDLYLSGGVVFGDAGGSGTASSNSLDSYEEGTWTPVLKRDGSTNNATITLSGDALYTKVGRMVTVSFYLSAIDYSAVTDGTNAIITGFPFTGTSTWYAGSIGYGTSTNASYTTWVLSTLTGYFLNSNNNGFRSGTVDLNRGMFTITYQTS